VTRRRFGHEQRREAVWRLSGDGAAGDTERVLVGTDAALPSDELERRARLERPEHVLELRSAVGEHRLAEVAPWIRDDIGSAVRRQAARLGVAGEPHPLWLAWTPTWLTSAAPRRARGVNRSRLAERYIDEGMRTDDHPGVVFRDGPAGSGARASRRAPTCWEVIAALRSSGLTGDAALEAATKRGGLTPSHMRAAVSY
jgi:hypothetical protein